MSSFTIDSKFGERKLPFNVNLILYPLSVKHLIKSDSDVTVEYDTENENLNVCHS